MIEKGVSRSVFSRLMAGTAMLHFVSIIVVQFGVQWRSRHEDRLEAIIILSLLMVVAAIIAGNGIDAGNWWGKLFGRISLVAFLVLCVSELEFFMNTADRSRYEEISIFGIGLVVAVMLVLLRLLVRLQTLPDPQQREMEKEERDG